MKPMPSDLLYRLACRTANSRTDGKLSRGATGLLTAGLLYVASGFAVAADFSLTSGNSFDLGGGTLDLDCANFTVHNTATFNAGSGHVLLSGNWSNQGVFNPGTSMVTFDDDCGPASTSVITGATNFHNFIANTTSGHGLTFGSGETQSVMNDLVLTGAAGQLLRIRSTTEGTQAFLELDGAGSQTISYVDVKDNNAPVPGQWLAPGPPFQFDSVDSGNNYRWFLNLPVQGGPGAGREIPILSAPGLALLIVLIALAAAYSRGVFRFNRS